MSACATKFGVEIAAEAAAGPVGWVSAGLSATAFGAAGAIYLGKYLAEEGHSTEELRNVSKKAAEKGIAAMSVASTKVAHAASVAGGASVKTTKETAKKGAAAAALTAKTLQKTGSNLLSSGSKTISSIREQMASLRGSLRAFSSEP
jgi:hypothetical protein